MSRFAIGEMSGELLWNVRRREPDHPVIRFLRMLARERARPLDAQGEPPGESWGSIIVVMVDPVVNHEARERIERALAEPDGVSVRRAAPWLPEDLTT